jgi:hypothetical protein
MNGSDDFWYYRAISLKDDKWNIQGWATQD